MAHSFALGSRPFPLADSTLYGYPLAPPRPAHKGKVETSEKRVSIGKRTRPARLHGRRKVSGLIGAGGGGEGGGRGGRSRNKDR